LDVGQGQCILLQSEGKTYLVDCGGDSDTWAADIAAKRLLSQGIHHLDGVILTHYDRDHAAGVSYLLSRVSAEIIYLPNCVDADGTVATIKASHSGDTFIVSEDTCINFGKAKISLIPSRTKLSDNESGVCVLFQTENCDILITGDRSIAGERELMRYFELPQLELLIVGHHGSKNSTGLSLLEKTSPQIAIISVGEDNSFGHPAQETLQRLLEAGCEIYRTDRDGTIIFRR
jgi:competence protein ComEC